MPRKTSKTFSRKNNLKSPRYRRGTASDANGSTKEHELFQIPGSHNPCLMNSSSVKNYSQENLQNLDINLTQTKQPFEMSNTMTNVNQFSENICLNANNFQASDLTSLPMHNRQELKKKQRKFLLEPLLNFSHSHKSKPFALPLNPFGVQQTP